MGCVELAAVSCRGLDMVVEECLQWSGYDTSRIDTSSTANATCDAISITQVFSAGKSTFTRMRALTSDQLTSRIKSNLTYLVSRGARRVHMAVRHVLDLRLRLVYKTSHLSHCLLTKTSTHQIHPHLHQHIHNATQRDHLPDLRLTSQEIAEHFSKDMQGQALRL